MSYTQGFLRKSSSGKYVGVLKYKDPAGQWRQLTKTFTKDPAESEHMLAEWRALMQAEKQATETEGSRTVETAVRATLSAQLARGRIERSTHDMQLSYAERCIFPELGSGALANLTSAAAQEWLDQLCLTMAPSSARIPYSVLRKACERAVRSGELAVNPLASIEQPRRAKAARAYLPPSSVALLEQAADERWGPAHPLTCATKLALYAGLRAGECCGLRWRDISPRMDWIRIATSIGRSSRGCYVKAPKNASSEREVPIVTPLAKTLFARQSESGMVDSPPELSWFVCGKRDLFQDPRILSTEFAKLCGCAGVTDSDGRRATFHALRHTFATEAVRAGVDVRTLADFMGHSDANMTLNVYAASGEDAKFAAATRLEAAHTTQKDPPLPRHPQGPVPSEFST